MILHKKHWDSATTVVDLALSMAHDEEALYITSKFFRWSCCCMASHFSKVKPWSILCRFCSVLCRFCWRRATAVVLFRILTRYICLWAYRFNLYGFNLTKSSDFFLFTSGQLLTVANLDKCFALKNLDITVENIVELVA